MQSIDVASYEADLSDRVAAYGGARGRDLVAAAVDYAGACHAGFTRFEGLPYVTHALAVGALLADWKAPADIVAAGVIHDVLNQDASTQPDAAPLADRFPPRIVRLVKQVATIGRFHAGVVAHVPQSLEPLGPHQMSVVRSALRRSPHAVIIKLADRLHNADSLGAMPPRYRAAFADAVYRVYAPCAHQLGMLVFKRQIEDRCLLTCEPEHYAAADMLRSSLLVDPRFEMLRSSLAEVLSAHPMEARVAVDVMHRYGIHRRTVERAHQQPGPADIARLVVIVPTADDCYRALGVVHARWRPLGDVEDRIAYPMPNGYRAFNTVVSEPKLGMLHVAICSENMHLVNARGVTAAWLAPARRRARVKQLLPKIEPLPRRPKGHIMVLTPMGEVRVLPSGATPVDFAYAIHRELGDRCLHAMVNGERAALGTRLQDGDIVKIIPNHGAAMPDRGWLAFVATPLARRRITQVLRRSQAVELVAEARDRIGLFHDVTAIISNRGINIAYLHANSLIDEKVLIRIGLGHIHDDEIEQLRALIAHAPHVLKVETRAFDTREGAHPESVAAHREGGNPYTLNPVVHEAFKGRAHEIGTILSLLREHRRPNPIFIWGQKRIGKTSLLMRLEHHELSAVDWIPIRISLQEVWGQPIASFLHAIAREIERKVGGDLAAPKLRRMARGPMDFFRAFMDRVTQGFRGTRLVIMIDEFAGIGSLKEEGASRREVFAYLRSLAQDGTRVSLIFSGGGLPDRLRSEAGLDEILAAADQLPMGCLETQDAVALITDRVEGTHYSDGAIRRLTDATRCHPFYLQHLCGRAYRAAAGGSITEAGIDATVASAVGWDGTPGDYFAHFWRLGLSDPAAETANLYILSTLAARDAAGDGIGFAQIAAGTRPHLRTAALHRQVRDLVAYGSIRRADDDRYSIAIPFFAAWMRNNHPPAQVARTFET